MDTYVSAPVLAGLKDFQKQTVEYVFRRLYLDDDRVKRFLVADEVGLGKTLVAKGVIAKAIEHLWEDVERIGIIYICANRDIARQNVNRLNVTKQQEFQLASRLTLLPMYMSRLHGNKLNFISFTPRTSFDLRSAEGIATERAMIYHILREGWDLGNSAGPKNVLQCGVSRDNWHFYLNSFLSNHHIDSVLSRKYLDVLARHKMRKKFFEMCDRFAYARKYNNIPREDRHERRKLVGELRSLLAESCVAALEPALVIMDEFQRFRDLLDGKDEMAQLANKLFDYPGAKVILLSATPYKMYTMHRETAEDNHYSDFIRTIGFLLNDDAATSSFENDLERFRRGLLEWDGRNSLELREAKSTIEHKLKKVMVRTERVAHTQDRSAMIAETRHGEYALGTEDIMAFKALDTIAAFLKVGDTVEYWKSAPYLINMMDRSGYELKKEFVDRCQHEDEELVDTLQDHANQLLSWRSIRNYERIDPRNFKLRSLIEHKVDSGGWRLLWVPASLPYYRVDQGPYAAPEIQGFTKALVFSSWLVVPKVISMLVSYEAERRMVIAYEEGADYSTERSRRSALLRFSLTQGRPGSMSALLLLYPCLSLAREIDPLKLGAVPGESLQDKSDIINYIQQRLRETLDPLIEKYRTTDAENDERWYWVSLALLDSRSYWPAIKDWLTSHEDKFQWQTNFRSSDFATGDKAETASVFEQYVSLFMDCLDRVQDLGHPPKDLFEVLSKIAIAAPGVVALRSLLRRCPNLELHEDISWLLGSAAKVAMGFRTLFNLPESMTLIRSIIKSDDSRYWEAVLDYCVDGNLQAVVDEYVHVLNESLGLKDIDKKGAIPQIADEVYNALSIRTAGPDFDEIILSPIQKKVELVGHQIRCHYALRYGDARTEIEGGEIRADQVRSAFNSPFRPFVLATTSIGQEGLDFHQYCHEVYHWNLPSNPVDLEQREGRVHRYKGHVIRRNLALKSSLTKLLEEIHQSSDPWEIIFDQACCSRESDQSDLIPFWIYECDGGYKVNRYIPILPLSRDNDRLKYLIQSVAVYRMVLGQPRQEDLVDYLVSRMQNQPECESLLECQLDLRPTKP